MAESKWKSEEIVVGRTMTAVFRTNDQADSPYRVRASRLDGRRSPKIVLSKDVRIVPGVPCLVRVLSITKPGVPDHGLIEVEWAAPSPFQLDGVWLDPQVGKKLQVALDSGLNILLDGPQGCGKTVTARAVADSLGMQFVFFNCGAVVEASDFFATIQVRASESGSPITDFVKTEVLEAIEAAHHHPERRYLVFLDELNRCPESARNALMPALDSTRKVFHPIENRFVGIPDNVQFIAAVNRGREFSGTFGIDAAQLDRFAPLQMTYLPAEEEVNLLVGRHEDLSPSLIQHIVAVARAVRGSAELPSSLSVRATEEACVFLEHPLYVGDATGSLLEILKTSFCGRFSGRWDEVSSDAGGVWAICRKTLKDRGLSVPED